MLDYILIAILIIAGIAFIIAEIIFVPGTTIVGILGLSMGAYGVYRSYELYGATVGHSVLALSMIGALAATIYSFKSGAWKRFAQKGQILAKVNENLTKDLKKGQEGISISSLKPVGKAEFNNKEYEVSSLGNFVGENTPIRILKIEHNKIHVEPIN